ncbi:hypothetical protein FHR88_006510 [Bradyrhizobium betae]|uniref:Uncharacterized protein n=1 Tax=Bradyrhizobium betae TaxID=244734 RepID=A0A5P6P7L6_9BRAD|nr:hypothetical protein [Bradyrhizobium betae]QFI74008.1 hypothetical protein F8237_17320 [Bradyrhizobium betae]
MVDAMNNETLFNCYTHNAEPEWSGFTALEIGGCIDEGDITHGGVPDNLAQFWTVYGRCTWGGVEAISDCDTRVLAVAVAAELGRRSNLPVRNE